MSPDVEPRPIVARPVGHHAPGFADQQRAGGHVPRAERLLEVAVEHTGRGPGEVEARRSGPAQVLEATQRAPRTRGGTRRGDRPWPGTGSRSRRSPRSGSRALTVIGSPLRERPATSARRVRVAEQRSVHDPDDGHAVVPRARPTRRPPGSRAGSWRSRRAGRRAIPRRPALAALLLAEHREGWPVTFERLAHGPLARSVDVAHPVAGRLLARRCRPRRSARRRSRRRRRRASSAAREQRPKVELAASRRQRRAHCVEQLGRRRRHELPPRIGVRDEELPVVGVDDRRTGFATHEKTAEVVPRRDGRLVEIGVERARRPRRTARARPSRGTGAASTAVAVSGIPESATTASSTRRTADGASSSPSRHAPPPRAAVVRTPVAWFVTRAQSGPSASTAHSEMDQYGMSREQFVEPSTGSRTTVIVGVVAAGRDPTPRSRRRRRPRAGSAAPRRRRRGRARTAPGAPYALDEPRRSTVRAPSSQPPRVVEHREELLGRHHRTLPAVDRRGERGLRACRDPPARRRARPRAIPAP